VLAGHVAGPPHGIIVHAPVDMIDNSVCECADAEYRFGQWVTDMCSSAGNCYWGNGVTVWSIAVALHA